MANAEEFSKKEKTFAARQRQFIFHFRNVRQLSPLECRERIVMKQSARLLLAKPVDNHVAGRLQTKRPASRAVRIASHKMNKAFTDPPQRILLRTGAESSSQCAPGDLREAAVAHPLFQALRMCAQNSVTFRVGDYRPHPGKLNFVQRLIHRRGNRKLVELHKQEIALIDAKVAGLVAQGFEILRIQMKIAAGGYVQAAADSCLQFIAKKAHMRKVEKISTVGVRRGDDMRNSIGNRGFRHSNGFFDGGGAIIEAGQNMTVQIDHSNEPSLVPPGTESLHRAEREKNSCKNLAHHAGLNPFGYFPSGDAA